jgi:prephenate dehydrogenase
VSTGPVAIVGVGLMGGSLGLALGGAREVVGVDPDPEALRVALAVGAVDRAAGSLEEAAEGAEAVVLATPMPALEGLARRALAASPEDCLVTDLGSAKAALLAALSPADRERFIGGHPVCGAERTGVAFARRDLFRGATWFLTPGAEARPELFQRLHGLVGSVGARPVAIDAGVHDRLMALVSHLPHVLAGALVNQAAATAPEGREALRSAGPSFGDLTRVAGSNPPLWADILLANREAVLEALGAYAASLDEVAGALRAGDREWLLGFIGEAAGARARLRAAKDAGPAEPARLVIAVPNRPGAISEIATALGHAHINIEDLHLRPGPPDGEGELELVVDGPEAAREAARLIAERGYPAEVASSMT